MKVRSNYHRRPLLYIGDIPDKVRDDNFDYLREDEADYVRFFKYQGTFYCLDQFTATSGLPHPFEGSLALSWSNGILVGGMDGETVIVGTYTL